MEKLNTIDAFSLALINVQLLSWAFYILLAPYYGFANFLSTQPKTLCTFIDYFRKKVDSKADTFLIDPSVENPKAKHVYEKAGFIYQEDFMMGGECSGAGKLHHLLVKKYEPAVVVVEATLKDYPLIQNMARFYVYDLSRTCGHISTDWALPADGLYECFDFKIYFEDPRRKPYLVKVYDEIAGFVLLNRETIDKTHTWNMGEFFILAKFQDKRIGERVAHMIWNQHPGIWEVSVIPENIKGYTFWKKTISYYKRGLFTEIIKEVPYDKHQPKRIIFTFDTEEKDLEIQAI